MLKGDKANTEGVLIFSLFFSNVCWLVPARAPSDDAGIETRKARVTARSEILRLKKIIIATACVTTSGHTRSQVIIPFAYKRPVLIVD